MIIAVQSNVNLIHPFIQYQTGSDFVCRIRFGNLLCDSGDVLLCPLGNGFVPSNPLSHWVLEKEGKWLKKKLAACIKVTKDTNAIFLPCRKLKYRGVIFVAVDFYLQDRVEINKKHIGEALQLAQKYGCAKLSCPENFLYDLCYERNGYNDIFFQMCYVLEKYSGTKINFMIDFVIKPSLDSFKRLKNTILCYDFSKTYFEKLPDCAEILPWYRRKLWKIRRASSLNCFMAKKVRRLLTDDSISEKKKLRTLRQLKKKLGDYYETHTSFCNEGYLNFLLRLCNEMPWNKEKIESLSNSI